MQSFLLFIVGIFATTPSIAAAAAADNTITITTEWNGTVLADEDIVNIKFSVTSDNELQARMDAAAVLIMIRKIVFLSPDRVRLCLLQQSNPARTDDTVMSRKAIQRSL
jgi:hypothetical protein